MALAATRLGVAGTSQGEPREPRHMASFRRATTWLNGPALSAGSLAGRVVLVQFGTYTCINWLRTLPYVRAWHARYPQLVVIGVHAPEFPFEKNLENVRRAIPPLRLEFPIAVDNDLAIWRAFENRYWPALYFIDGRGRIRSQHFGEGEYERSERTIRELLAESGVALDEQRSVPAAVTGFELQADWGNLRSPETYLGYERTDRFSSPGGVAPRLRRSYDVPNRLALNQWALAGEWTLNEEAATSNTSRGRLVCRFQARDVHLVMGPRRQSSPVRFSVSVDGQRPASSHGLDVDESGEGMVAEQRLYQLVRQPGAIIERTLDIEFLDAGVDVFAFTFG
jgi:hypothetical protein